MLIYTQNNKESSSLKIRCFGHQEYCTSIVCSSFPLSRMNGKIKDIWIFCDIGNRVQWGLKAFFSNSLMFNHFLINWQFFSVVCELPDKG